MASRGRSTNPFERFSSAVSHWAGSTSAFAIALGVIVVWAVTGPIFGFSDTWQLVINTGTTIVTFLMVFLIQRAQNKDAMAHPAQAQRARRGDGGREQPADPVEDLSEEELTILHKHYATLATMSKKEARIAESHSVEEARQRHSQKHGAKR